MSNNVLKGFSALKGLSEPVETEAAVDASPETVPAVDAAKPDNVPDPYEGFLMQPARTPTEVAFAEELKRGRGRPPGKRSDPEYERLTVLVRKDTRKGAERSWEDATGKDMSELVEVLLRDYMQKPQQARPD